MTFTDTQTHTLRNRNKTSKPVPEQVAQLYKDVNVVGRDLVIDVWKDPVLPMFQNQGDMFGERQRIQTTLYFLKNLWNRSGGRQLASILLLAKRYRIKGRTVDATGTCRALKETMLGNKAVQALH